MRFPGFNAETSVYKTGRHYRVIGQPVQADGISYSTLSVNDRVGSRPDFSGLKTDISSDFIYVDRHFPTAFFCGALGQACCRAPIQNVPAFGPLVSCQQGLGCDITTNKCVSSCGGTGQACCDGPETRAPKWTADGKVYSPNSWNMQEMCKIGVCDKQSHRCITCGTRNGGPCCSSDAAQVTSRCYRDAQTGHQLACNNPWPGSGESCVECGSGGQPTCKTAGEAPCDDGLVESNGICAPCGQAGLPACDRGQPCRDGRSVPDRSFSKCLPAGGPNQPCRPDGVLGGCDYQGLFCNSGHICQPCGEPGKTCCPPGKLPNNAACTDPGECRDNLCFACGYDNMPVCASSVPCKCLCKPIDGWCRPCGHDGQACCSQPWWSCYDGSHCEDGICRQPSPPPPPQGHLKTCNGEDFGLSTIKRTVFIKNSADKCILEFSYNANSAQEAYACARREHGDAVVTETINPYTFALSGDYGCNTVTVGGTDESEAQTCAQSQCLNCVVTPGDCP